MELFDLENVCEGHNFSNLVVNWPGQEPCNCSVI